MKSLNLYFWFYTGGHWFVNQLFLLIADKLKEKYPNILFNIIKTNDFQNRDNFGIGSAHIFTIENPLNKKYIMLSFWDKNIELFYDKNSDLNLVQLIASGGINEIEYNLFKELKKDRNLRDFNFIHTPYTYTPYSTKISEYIEEIIQSSTEERFDNIIFRGLLYEERKSLNILFNRHEKFLITDKKIDTLEYLKEQYNHKLCLSLNGIAEVSNRDIELFGLGKAVMRLDFNLKFKDPLIPNYHYISLGKFDFFHYQTKVSADILKKNIEECYEKNIKNETYLKYIGENARKWYLKNCTLQSAANLFFEVIELDRLFKN